MAEKKTPSLEEARNAVDVAILAGHMYEEERLVEAARTAFVVAMAAKAPVEVTYLIQGATMEWGDFDGPDILLKMARERLDAEIEEATGSS